MAETQYFKSERKIPVVYLLPLLFAAGFALSSPGADADLWGHVQFGRDTLQNGVAATTTYSFTAEDYRWINHENLSEVLFASIVDRTGPIGLLTLRFAFGVLVVGGITWRMRQSACSLLTIFLVTGLLILNLIGHWSIRPQLLSYSLFALMLFALDFAFRGENRIERLLWLICLPLLMLIWTNAHGGFVAGLCVMLLYLGSRSVETIVRQRRVDQAQLLATAAIALAACAITLVNPYGLDLHRWLLESLGTPRPEITEWHGLSLDNSQTWILLPLIAIGSISVVLNWRRVEVTSLVVLCVIGWQAISHQRHIAFFAIACGFWLPPHIDAALRKFNLYEGEDFQPSTALWAVLGGVAVLICVMLPSRLGSIEVERDEFPVSAIGYLSEQNVSGNLVVTYNWSQYAISALADQGIRVGFDGRFRTCYPDEVVDMHFDLVIGDIPTLRHRKEDSPPFDAQRVLSFAEPDLALISRQQENSVVTLRAAEQWILLYQDELAQVWGKRSRFGNPESPDFIAETQRVISDQQQVGSLPWPALPRRTTAVAAESDPDSNNS